MTSDLHQEDKASDDALMSVGAVAARLGVAPATLRSWGRRYGLAPAGRTGGGHRRYTAEDLSALLLMQDLVSQGATPAKAARQALAAAAAGASVEPAGASVEPAGASVEPAGASVEPAQTLPESRRPAGAKADARRRPGGPGGRVLAVPRSSAEARGLARAAGRLDGEAVCSMVADLLAKRGAIATWDDVLRPVLVAAGLKWARTGDGIDVEHVLSEAITEALRAHRAIAPRPVPGRPVLVACAPEDLHALPLHIVAAALAERQVPVRVLGPRVPDCVLASAARRLGAAAMFVWRQVPPALDTDLGDRLRARPAPMLVVGGPGWDGVDLPTWVHRPPDLRSAVSVLAGAAK